MGVDMDEREELVGYDLLWAEAKRLRVTVRGVEPLAEALRPVYAAMVAHCLAAVAEHEARDKDSYRSCMWRRRLYLHRKNRHGDVYSGQCAFLWQRAYDRGQMGAVPAGFEGHVLGKASLAQAAGHGRDFSGVFVDEPTDNDTGTSLRTRPYSPSHRPFRSRDRQST